MILAIVQSSSILAIALISVAFMRRRSAAARHAVLTVGLFGSLAAPLVGSLLPDLGSIRFAPDGLYARIQDQAELLENHDPDRTSVKSNGASPSAEPSQASAAMSFWVWLAGIGVAAAVLLAAIGRILWMTSRSEPLRDARWLSAASGVSRDLALKRAVRLLKHSGDVLGTLGFVRPRIFLPRDADRWSDERIRIVLTHELAHVQRFDWLVQLLAEIGRAVYWFNPLFWLACRRLRIESEHACDDVVLNAGFDARDYAAHLLEIARELKHSGRMWAPVMSMSRAPNLERRFIAMLNPSLNRRSLTRAALLAICVLGLGVTLPLAAMRAPEELPPLLTAAPKVLTVAHAAPEPETTQPLPPAPKPKPAPMQPVPAQALGDLTGTVSDPSGAVVPGVRLTLTGIDQSFEEAKTDEAGRYEFRGLRDGLYLLSANLPGFVSASRRVEISSGQPVRLNFTLTLGSVAQAVQVSAVGLRAPAPVEPRRIRVGGNVVAARLVSAVKPVYPADARAAGIVGMVNLQGIIGVDGTLTGLRVLSGNRTLTEAAMEAVRQWRYQPTMLNGEPVEVITDIAVEFELVQ